MGNHPSVISYADHANVDVWKVYGASYMAKEPGVPGPFARKVSD